MKSAIAILTYNRVGALATVLAGTSQFCSHYPLAVFEDCGQRDRTEKYLLGGAEFVGHDDELWADKYQVPNTKAPLLSFMGTTNLGVTGNTNRALRWFMTQTDCDHLCILNDDLHVLGDFPKLYGDAHADLGVELFCFNDFPGEDYRWITTRQRGYEVHIFRRYTGIMMSVTRELVDKIGYYDPDFGRFGEEHCDYTNRARFAGGIQLNGQDQACLDVAPSAGGKSTDPVLKHQEVPTSMQGMARHKADQDASDTMRYASWSYRNRNVYREFMLGKPRRAGAYQGAGIPVNNLLFSGYSLITDRGFAHQ